MSLKGHQKFERCLILFSFQSIEDVFFELSDTLLKLVFVNWRPCINFMKLEFRPHGCCFSGDVVETEKLSNDIMFIYQLYNDLQFFNQ